MAGAHARHLSIDSTCGSSNRSYSRGRTGQFHPSPASSTTTMSSFPARPQQSPSSLLSTYRGGFVHRSQTCSPASLSSVPIFPTQWLGQTPPNGGLNLDMGRAPLMRWSQPAEVSFSHMGIASTVEQSEPYSAISIPSITVPEFSMARHQSHSLTPQIREFSGRNTPEVYSMLSSFLSGLEWDFTHQQQ